jgi:hypothetical protein
MEESACRKDKDDHCVQLRQQKIGPFLVLFEHMVIERKLAQPDDLAEPASTG